MSINTDIETLGNGKLQIFHGDALEVLQAIPDSSVDLIFVDPPYNKGWIQKILAKLVKCPLLADNGWLIAEHSMHDDIVGAVPEGYEIFRSQQYGETVLSFLRKSA
jgi:16S rRNA G966 N2-methylase RsmD